MAHHVSITPARTYATEANAHKAVNDKYSDASYLRYMIVWNAEGRCYPVFLGEPAIQAGVHFNFCVVG